MFSKNWAGSKKDAAKPKLKRKKRQGPSSRDFIDNKELLKEIIESKRRLERRPSLGSSALTPRLAQMLVMMVDRYATNSSWAGYSYIDEFKGDAILNLYQKWHKFDEKNYDNPFAFYTQIMYHCFLGGLGREKKQQRIKDRMLESSGKLPSMNRQMEHEAEIKEAIARDYTGATKTEDED